VDGTINVSLFYFLHLRKYEDIKGNFDVLLTVHLSIILVTDQLDPQILVL